jgi:hypothetical protein
MEGSSSIEPIRTEPEFPHDFGGGQFNCIRQGLGTNYTAPRFAQRHDVHVLGLAGTGLLDEQGASATDYQPNWSRYPCGEEPVEELEGSDQIYFVHQKER